MEKLDKERENTLRRDSPKHKNAVYEYSINDDESESFQIAE